MSHILIKAQGRRKTEQIHSTRLMTFFLFVLFLLPFIQECVCENGIFNCSGDLFADIFCEVCVLLFELDISMFWSPFTLIPDYQDTFLLWISKHSKLVSCFFQHNFPKLLTRFCSKKNLFLSTCTHIYYWC